MISGSATSPRAVLQVYHLADHGGMTACGRRFNSGTMTHKRSGDLRICKQCYEVMKKEGRGGRWCRYAVFSGAGVYCGWLASGFIAWLKGLPVAAALLALL